MGEAAVAVRPVGEHLVGGDRDRPDLLDAARVPPTASGATVVRSASSRCHCCTEAALLVTISVSEPCCAIAASPTIVLPAPHGSTTTPAPVAANAAAASRW